MFDIILVYTFGRIHYYYLNIIKYLSPKYKIGLLLSDEKDFTTKPFRKTFMKVKETEKKFRSLCIKYGAERVYVNHEYKCNLLLMQIDGRTVYTEDYISKFKKNISWKKLIGFFYMAGNIVGLDLLKELGSSKYFASGKILMRERAKSEGRLEEIEGLDIIETGFPFSEYPVFDDLNLDIDYLVAFPTTIHFLRNKNKEKNEFLKMLLKTANKIDKNDKVYIKYHNVRDKQRFFTRKIGRSVCFLGLCTAVSDFFVKYFPFYKDKFYHLSALFRYNIIELKYPSLEELTEYSNFGAELFLPCVRKGILIGHSQTVWHALYNRLPVYNCDPQKKDDSFVSYLEAYRIECCNGNLFFDKNNFKRIDEECRNADMIKLIEEELAK